MTGTVKEKPTRTDPRPQPDNTIEITLLRLDGETFEDAVRNVMAYMIDDCVRMRFLYIRFICKHSGDSTIRRVTPLPDVNRRDIDRIGHRSCA